MIKRAVIGESEHRQIHRTLCRVQMEFINNRTENKLTCKFSGGWRQKRRVYMQISKRFAFYIHN